MTWIVANTLDYEFDFLIAKSILFGYFCYRLIKNPMQTKPDIKQDISFEDFKSQILDDYKIAVTSRECSLLGRREVLTGKAKFGIFGDGKELPQLAMAKAFKNGDFRFFD